MKPYRVGVIGFGFIGKVHAYGYLNLPFYYDPLPPGGRCRSPAFSAAGRGRRPRRRRW